MFYKRSNVELLRVFVSEESLSFDVSKIVRSLL